jgi:hypothetical protein
MKSLSGRQLIPQLTPDIDHVEMHRPARWDAAPRIVQVRLCRYGAMSKIVASIRTTADEPFTATHRRAVVSDVDSMSQFLDPSTIVKRRDYGGRTALEVLSLIHGPPSWRS